MIRAVVCCACRPPIAGSTSAPPPPNVMSCQSIADCWQLDFPHHRDSSRGHRCKNGFFLYRWFRDVSIARKLYFTVGTMALLIGVELFVLLFSLNTLSSLRAYVGGEGLWSKAQKDAVFHLYRYGVSRTDKDYELFEQFMKVPLGDAKTRRELLMEHRNLDAAREGFLEGRNHPDDIEGMISLFIHFRQCLVHKQSHKNMGRCGSHCHAIAAYRKRVA